jgi:phospholipase C
VIPSPSPNGSGDIRYADALYYADANGDPTVPPANQIENPNPRLGTNNWYTQDGYSGGS